MWNVRRKADGMMKTWEILAVFSDGMANYSDENLTGIALGFYTAIFLLIGQQRDEII
jgi:hypothetical protein